MREDLQTVRIRHPLVLRQAQVVAIAPRGERLLRITFRGPQLAGFVSASFDDHVKVFFPAPGEDMPDMPALDASGQIVRGREPGRSVIARDYTPRRFDPERNELDIEFVLHGEGPGTQWAARARIGQTLGFGGPRGSMVIPAGFDWHWLIGDETALPAIGRRLEELPADSQATVMLMQDEPDLRHALPSAASVTRFQFAGCDHSQPDSPLLRHLDTLPLPDGEGFVWVAGELATVRALRTKLLEKGMDKRRIRASSYWQHGACASHQTLDD
jgi:NADPH-dependent ferric siderophore reductase